MSLLDSILYYNEDTDLEPENITEFTEVKPSHLVELYGRGLIKLRESFIHRGWCHKLKLDENGFYGVMWQCSVGESYHWYDDEGDCWG